MNNNSRQKRKAPSNRPARRIGLIMVLFLVFTVLFDVAAYLSANWLEIAPTQSDFLRYGETIAALIAAFLVVDQLNKEAEAEEQESLISQSSFIKDYNEAFIRDPNMADVEAWLEKYYVDYLGKGVPPKANTEETPKTTAEETVEKRAAEMDPLGAPGTKGRQHLINYLVYLEGLAAVIYNGSMDLSTIDSLFGYRFFIAVNNDLVQEQELVPYAIHYQGIYWLYDTWVKYRVFLEYVLMIQQRSDETAGDFELRKKELIQVFKDESGKEHFWPDLLDGNWPAVSGNAKNARGSGAAEYPPACRNIINSLKNSAVKDRFGIPMQSAETSLLTAIDRKRRDNPEVPDYAALVERYISQITL